MSSIVNWRIATTEGLLPSGLFIARGIPTPTQIEYRDHSVRVEQSEGGEARHGYHVFSALWLSLTPEQSYYLRAITEFARTNSGLLYMTVNRAMGAAIGDEWVDIRGRPRLSDIIPAAPIFASSGWMAQNIQLTLVNVVVLANPAADIQ